MKWHIAFTFLLCMLAMASAALAGHICHDGEVIWHDKQAAGCVFTKFEDGERSQCKGSVVLSPDKGPFPGTCWVCIEAKLVPLVNDATKWSELTVGFWRKGAKTGDFSCLGPSRQVILQEDIRESIRSPLPRNLLPTPCTWTPWLNRDRPSGSGDYETLADFAKADQACAKPSKIECRTRAGQRPWSTTGEIYTCDVKSGGVCQNAKQPSGQSCSDYEVRFCC